MNHILPVISIASIYAFRMLGLFMILPVFAILAQKYHAANPALIGTALGAYGLTQAIFQMPFGVLSDKYGRKAIILLGLVLFAMGSIVAASANNIYWVIIGRAFQGAGAIGSTLLALVADVTSDEFRAQAMAIIGASIGSSFALALILGPIISSWFGLSGIFWFTALLAGCGILALFIIVPTPTMSTEKLGSIPKHFKTVITNKQLMLLNYAIFAQHAILTASFVVLPRILNQSGIHQHWKLYLAIMFVIFLGIWQFKLFKQSDNKGIYRTAILAIIMSQLSMLILPLTLFTIIPILFIFFAGFTFLEVALPSQTSKASPPNGRGTAMGIYSSCQFLGIFFGGAAGGILHQNLGIYSVFVMTSLFAISWFIFAYLPLSGIAYLKQDNTIDDLPRT